MNINWDIIVKIVDQKQSEVFSPPVNGGGTAGSVRWKPGAGSTGGSPSVCTQTRTSQPNSTAAAPPTALTNKPLLPVLEAIQSSNSKVIHLGAVRLPQSLQDVSEGQAQGHVGHQALLDDATE